jgi:hypothetical protein
VQISPVQLAQSVTLPVGGAYNTLRFRWMPAPGAGPLTGSLYILGQEYLGRVSAVGTAPGLIARSIRIEGDEYVFDAAVTLSGGTKYWFAADSPVRFLCSQSTSDIYAGGDLYTIGGTAGSPSDPAYARFYVNSPNERLDASFTLRGNLTR